MKRLLLSTALPIVFGALYFGTLQPADAGQIINVVGYETPNAAAFYAATTDNYNYYTGQITLDLADGSKITVFCADLNHTLHAGQYEFGILTHDGAGHTIDQPTSNLLGRIAAFGLANDNDNAVAAQAMIWDKEYGIGSVFASDTPDHITAHSDFNALTASLPSLAQQNNGQWAVVLIPYGQGWSADAAASQQMIVGTLADAPEPTTIALLGLGLLGTVAFARRQTR